MTRWYEEHPIEDLKDDDEKTPLSQKLAKLAEVVQGYAYIAAFFILSTLVLFQAMHIMFNEQRDLLSNETIKKGVRAFTSAVAIVIVCVPEGLGLAVSIAMAFSIDKMKKQNLLVKEMAAAENLAYTNIICTGKTGTLTSGNMQVKKIFINGGYRNYARDRDDFEISKSFQEYIVSCITLNNDAKIEMSDDALYTPTGNKTEVAMLNFLYELNIEAHTELSNRQNESEI